jgi:hypothetical protein
LTKLQILASAASIAVATTMPAVNARAAEDDGQPGGIGTLAEVTVLNLKLVRTAMVTQDNALPISPVLVNAFSPVVVTCPGRAPKGCTVSVLVSSQVLNLPAGSIAQVNTTITGSAGAVEPATLVNVDSNPGGSSTHTMQWLKTAIPAGSAETVRIEMKLTAGVAQAGFRTATIALYKN